VQQDSPAEHPLPPGPGLCARLCPLLLRRYVTPIGRGGGVCAGTWGVWGRRRRILRGLQLGDALDQARDDPTRFAVRVPLQAQLLLEEPHPIAQLAYELALRPPGVPEVVSDGGTYTRTVPSASLSARSVPRAIRLRTASLVIPSRSAAPASCTASSQRVEPLQGHCTPAHRAARGQNGAVIAAGYRAPAFVIAARCLPKPYRDPAEALPRFRATPTRPHRADSWRK
jgi:hypothetical protein